MVERPLARASLRLRLGLKPEQAVSVPDPRRRRSKSSQSPPAVKREDEVAAARRLQVREILDRSEGILFGAQTLECWLGPIVYVALKDDVPVYVGRSRQGLRRVFSRHHKGHAFIGANLMVWAVSSVEDMKKLEQLLIEGLLPALNARQRGQAQRLSELTGLSITQARNLTAQLRESRSSGGSGTGDQDAPEEPTPEEPTP